MPCEKWYTKMLESYARICDRLGTENEDDDVEIIISMLGSIQREVALQMSDTVQNLKIKSK